MGTTPNSQEPLPPQTTPNIQDDFFSYVHEKFVESQGDRTTWVSKQVKFNKLRMRIKKTKTFPFIGCSNLRMPTAEIKIRKIKAALYNVVFGIRPIVQVIPPPGGDFNTALKVEKFLDHLLMDVMHIQNKCIIAIDQMLEQGFYILKPYWKLEIIEREENLSLDDLSMDDVFMLLDGKTTPDMIHGFLVKKFDVDLDDKVADDNNAVLDSVIQKLHSGEKDIPFSVQDITYDFPDLALVPPEKCYVPADSTFHPQDCQGIIHEFFLPLQTLKINAKYYGWNIDGVNVIEGYKTAMSSGLDTQKQENKDLSEGISRLVNPSQLVKIHEYQGWYKGNKACGYTAPDFNVTLKKIGLPFDNGKWSFVKIFYELTDDRWYSHRGIPELCEDIIKEIDIQHNMKIDQQTTRNAPMWMYRAGMVNPNLIQLIPNQAIPVNGMNPLNDTLTMLNNSNTNVEFSYEHEEQILSGRLEELLGQADFNLQSQINRRQPRTLGEVSLQNNAMQSVFSLDAGMLTEQFTELANMIWDLWCQYGSDDYEFNYFGKNGWEKIKLSKEEIQGSYKLTIRGNDRNTNPTVRLQKAEQILQMIENPLLLQTGVVGQPQLAASLKRVYQYLELDNWEELVNMQPPPPSPPPPPRVDEIMKIDWANLTDGEKAQILQQIGIKPDIQGRAMQKEQDMLQLAQDSGHLDRLHQSEQTVKDKQHEVTMTAFQHSHEHNQNRLKGKEKPNTNGVKK